MCLIFKKYVCCTGPDANALCRLLVRSSSRMRRKSTNKLQSISKNCMNSKVVSSWGNSWWLSVTTRPIGFRKEYEEFVYPTRRFNVVYNNYLWLESYTYARWSAHHEPKKTNALDLSMTTMKLLYCLKELRLTCRSKNTDSMFRLKARAFQINGLAKNDCRVT